MTSSARATSGSRRHAPEGSRAAREVGVGSSGPSAAGRASIDDFGCALTASPVQLQAFDRAIQLLQANVQAATDGQARGGDARSSIQQAALRGVASGGGRMPHLGTIQAAFGRHDVSGVQAHVGGAAKGASETIGAQAYATGNHVAFVKSPDLHTAAHEAAHVVQQRAGVQLAGGVGKVGDAYERQADQVADAVVQGQSAEAILDGPSGDATRRGGDGAGGAVQRRVDGESAPAGSPSVLKRQGPGGSQIYQSSKGCSGKRIYLFHAFGSSWQDRTLADTAHAQETRILTSALASMFEVVVDPTGGWSELLTALKDNAAYGIWWYSHGSTGSIKADDGEGNPSRDIAGKKGAGRSAGQVTYKYFPRMQAARGLRFVHMNACYSKTFEGEFRSILPKGCELRTAPELIYPPGVRASADRVLELIESTRRGR